MKNKTIAGYHLLMILSVIDREIHPEEDLVIRDFLVTEYPPPIPINLDKEMDIISGLHEEEYASHFALMLKMFDKESSFQEKLHLFEFAVSLIQADRKVTIEENEYIKAMIKCWKLASDS